MCRLFKEQVVFDLKKKPNQCHSLFPTKPVVQKNKLRRQHTVAIKLTGFKLGILLDFLKVLWFSSTLFDFWSLLVRSVTVA